MNAAAINALSPSEQVAEVLSRYLPYMAACRDHIISGLASVPFGTVLADYFRRGKMIRAVLVYLAAAAVGGDPLRATPAAAAAELCHGASLFHDDIIDEADERRNLPALHVKLGEPAALVLGDHLLLRAFGVLAEAERTHAPERVTEAIRVLSSYGQECCRGQLEELIPPTEADEEALYFSLVRGKTAALFAAAVTLGAVLEGGSPDQVDVLRTYGLNLGVAFQIRDDILDLTGDAEQLGKPVGNSLSQGRPLLPLIYLQRDGSSEAQADFQRWQQTGGSRGALVALLERERILQQVAAVQRRFINLGLAALEQLQASAEVEALRAFAEYAGGWDPQTA